MNGEYHTTSPLGISWRRLLPARLDEEGLSQSVLYAMIASVLALIFLCLGTAFFNPTNLVSVLQQTPEFALLSLAMGLSMVSGGIDLSVGSIVAVSGVASVLAAIAGKLKPDAILCSLAPKVKLATLSEKLGGFGRLARMNPNSPSIIGQGYNPVALAATLPPAAPRAAG